MDPIRSPADSPASAGWGGRGHGAARAVRVVTIRRADPEDVDSLRHRGGLYWPGVTSAACDEAITREAVK
jgi:hypothetical protein